MPDSFVPIVLAQDTGPAPAPAPAAPAPGTTGAPATGEAPSGGFGGMLPMFVVIFVIFYVLMIRPQSKERKKREAMVKQVKKKDLVVTTSGIHGEVVATDERTVTLEVDDGVRIKFDRAAIWQVTPKGEPGAVTAEVVTTEKAKGKS